MLGQQSDALAALPDLSGPAQQQKCATGTDGQNVEPPRLASCLAFSDAERRTDVRRDAVNGAREPHDENRHVAREKREKCDDSRSKIEVPPAGFEPAAYGLGNRCSIP